MKRLTAAAALILCSVSAFAGPQLDQFNQDIAAFTAAQAATPDKTIRYSDAQGPLARAVLDPQRINAMVAEALQEPKGGDQLKAALESYKPIMARYATAFGQGPGMYDEEYLDGFETMYQTMLASVKQLQGVKTEDIKDETMRPVIESAMKMVAAMPALLLRVLEKQLQEGRFAPSSMPGAIARIDRLRAGAATP